MAGYSQEQNKYSWQQGYRQNFPNNLLYTLNAGSATGMSATGSADEWALRSWFGRINYAFDNKYLLELNARYDGTSRFPASGRWGLFPSVSAGWKISEEPFVKENAPWIELLKIRGSWGKLGNQNIGNYPYQNIISLGQNYSFGGSLSSGAAVTTLANRAITWETTRIADVGFDMSILKGELSMSVDYFDKYTSGILYSISVSSVLGLTPSAVNAGAVKNTGVDILLNYRTNLGKVRFGISPNFSFVRNRVMELASGLKQDIGQNLFVGKPLGAIYGYVADGLFTDANDVANSPAQPYAAQPGLVKYKDLSGADGKPDGKTDATYDRAVIGNTVPKYTYGATITADYKGFDLSILLQGLAGFEKQMGSYMAFAFYNGGQIQRWQADNRWTTSNPNPHALYPKLTTLNMGSGTIATSTYWNRNASFLRMKNLQLGYSFSSNTLERLKINRLRLYVSGQNLFTINKFYKGWDPEMYQATGDGPSFYPITRVYTFGVNVKF
jgi:TonB-linked SusC/RagA family outer membrane protein